jgi:hypothetical protein
MLISKYALAVQIDNELFEIFDIFHFEKGTEPDLRYQKAISSGSKAIYTQIRNNIKIGAIFHNNELICESTKDAFSITEDENIYLFLSENKVFGFVVNKKEDLSDLKYQAAFTENVILIDCSLHDNVGFGDIYDGQKIVNAV